MSTAWFGIFGKWLYGTFIRDDNLNATSTLGYNEYQKRAIHHLALYPRDFTNITDAWNQAAGTAQEDEGMSLAQLIASCAAGLAAFGVCFLAFNTMRKEVDRIYEPATYLVPERQRMDPPPPGWLMWIKPVFDTRRRIFIEKAGMDAYCFVRFLFMQLKIFLPLACIVTPIVVCLNSVGVRDNYDGGLDRFAWGNLGTTHTNRYAGHVVMAVIVIIWFCYVIYQELIHYIEVRQTWMTSPSHRIRASATTVLVANIPDKWCHVKALDELFDVFPGGIRNIWVNRDFGDLLDKKRKQLELTRKLENAETALIRECQEKANATRAKALKDKRLKQMSRKQRKQLIKKQELEQNQLSIEMLSSPGVSTGNPKNPTNLVEQLKAQREKLQDLQRTLSKSALPMKIIGGGLGAVNMGLKGVGAGVGWGASAIGHGVGKVGKFGQNTVGGVAGMFKSGHRTGQSREEPQVVAAVAQEADPDHIHHDHVDSHEAAPAMESDLQNATLNLATDSDHLHHGPDGEENVGQKPSRRESDYLHHGPEPGADVGHKLSHRHSDYLHKSGTPPGLEVADIPRVQSAHAPTSIPERQGNMHHLNPRRLFRKHSSFPSPDPSSHLQDDEYPITRVSPVPDGSPSTIASSNFKRMSRTDEVATEHGRTDEAPAIEHVAPEPVEEPQTEKEAETDKKTKDKYSKMPPIIDWEVYYEKLKEEYDTAVWTNYMKPKDRETMRISLFPQSTIWWKIWPSWWPSLGKKVDVIIYCRLQLLQLNKEIAEEEAQLEKFPLMNSAFIQFNHQAAAHMACQSITHHKPKNMGPRIIEMDPKDVIWDNLSMTWWNKYIRTIIVLAIIIGIIITWAIPMAFVGLLSQLDSIANRLKWLHWVANLPRWLKSVIQGVLPPTLQAILLLLLPDLFRLLVEFTGVPTGVQVSLDLQAYWFIFLFIQVFLVVTLSSGLTNVIEQIANSPLSVPQILAQNLPKGSNYFFSYLILQALSSTSQQLSQLVSLFQWYVLGNIVDSTAREKFNRSKKLPAPGWGTIFPVHTNFTCIVVVYSVISPLMLVFGCIVSSLYLVVYRYNCLYVYRWATDSGGLFFPRAANQTFTGVYFMILALIGLFFLVRDEKNDPACIPHAIVMIVVGILVIIYQYMLNKSLGPLFTYVPITMEDEAQARQDEYEKVLESRFETVQEFGRRLSQIGDDDNVKHLNERLEELENDDAPPIPGFNYAPTTQQNGMPDISKVSPSSTNSSDRPRDEQSGGKDIELAEYKKDEKPARKESIPSLRGMQPSLDLDPEAAAAAHTNAINKAKEAGYLFQGYHDELEDLTPGERDLLVQRAFHHEALRMMKPAVWIPQDFIKVSDDEVKRSEALCREQGVPDDQNLWVTSEYSAIDAAAKVRFGRPPPDFNTAEEFMQL
ncbi:hypothetical protein HDK77DRAFT_449689 [Phyllosticta capitalensis]